jgi:hypothetical protein
LRIARAIRNNEGKGFAEQDRGDFPTHSEQVLECYCEQQNTHPQEYPAFVTLCNPRSKRKSNHFNPGPVGNSYVRAFLSKSSTRSLEVKRQTELPGLECRLLSTYQTVKVDKNRLTAGTSMGQRRYLAMIRR